MIEVTVINRIGRTGGANGKPIIGNPDFVEIGGALS